MKKQCPLKIMAKHVWKECEENQCAWWCEWANCCAMVAIPAELSDRMHDLIKTMEANQ